MVYVIVICERGEDFIVLREISDLGEFKETGFRGVLQGQVEDLEAFLEELTKRQLTTVSRVIPVEEFFKFKPENLLEILKEKVGSLVDSIGEGESFCVRVERRGFKGAISSSELERGLGEYVWQLLKDIYGKPPKVDLTNPDKLISIQTIGGLCGVALVDRKLREKYPIVRVK
ncbi:THUMP domain-containing protein [Candidatus Bathyarchaeota archaeon]|nr:THUMP domain-containing protein [Candidatus Bathyarchaeota archaeon]